MSDRALASYASGALPAIARTAVDLGKAAKSATRRWAYESDWCAFRGWSAAHHLDPLPAPPAAVGVYIAALGSDGGVRFLR